MTIAAKQYSPRGLSGPRRDEVEGSATPQARRLSGVDDFGRRTGAAAQTRLARFASTCSDRESYA